MELNDSIWVRTEPTIDGKSWIVTVEFDDDHIISLTRDEARAYSEAALKACAEAEYDVAVLGQLGKRVGKETALGSVLDLRKDRAPAPAIQGYTFTGGVNQQRKAFIALAYDGDAFAQLDLAPARGHAMHVLEAPIAADLDGAYLTYLRGVIGLAEGTSRAVIEELAKYRPAS